MDTTKRSTGLGALVGKRVPKIKLVAGHDQLRIDPFDCAGTGFVGGDLFQLDIAGDSRRSRCLAPDVRRHQGHDEGNEGRTIAFPIINII